jgi:triphosphoribosyl-dephospho-CoA synthase
MLEAAALRRNDSRRPTATAVQGFAASIGSLAISALQREAQLLPKPGLVSPIDSGSHRDMDFGTFMRSLDSLRGYFPEITSAGAAGPPFEALRLLGVAAEAKMLQATGGINTHRGAIFNLGLLCAAAGALRAEGARVSARAVCDEAAQRWGGAILRAANPASRSHGAEAARRYGSGGARREAAAGFPTALNVGLPAYREALRLTGNHQRAAVQCLFALIARLEDTNLLWRGGLEGLAFARGRAANFLAAGGVAADGWEERACHVHADFVACNLSPGGSADLLGVTLFLNRL